MRDEDDWTPAEQARLAGLGAAEDPPPALEGRVVAALRERGLLRRTRRGRWLAVAAGLLVFASGVGVGRATVGGRHEAPEGTRVFALLLYRGGLKEDAGGGEAARVVEYRRWAGGLAAEGRLIRGEKLKPAGGAASPDDLQGFFLLRAGSLDEVLSLARTCPHAAHGGRVAVQEVDPT